MQLGWIPDENGAIWRRLERQTTIVKEQFERGKGLHIATDGRRQFLSNKIRRKENLLMALLGELVQGAGQSLYGYLERLGTRLFAASGVQEND
jgi:hypothetical protein